MAGAKIAVGAAVAGALALATAMVLMAGYAYLLYARR